MYFVNTKLPKIVQIWQSQEKSESFWLCFSFFLKQRFRSIFCNTLISKIPNFWRLVNVDFLSKIYLILYIHLGNLTTHITIGRGRNIWSLHFVWGLTYWSEYSIFFQFRVSEIYQIEVDHNHVRHPGLFFGSQ